MNNLNIEVIATTIGTFLAGGYICYRVCKQKIDQFLKGWHGSVSSKIPRQSQIDLKVLKRMEEVKEIMDADRVHVYEFHNGEHYANGRSALKVSCTYEVCRAGTQSVQRSCMSVPLSVMPKYIAAILDNPIVNVKDIESIKDLMPATYNLKFSQNVQAYTNVVILDKETEPVGFIEVQWFDKNKFIENEHELLRLAAFIEENILINLDK